MKGLGMGDNRYMLVDLDNGGAAIQAAEPSRTSRPLRTGPK